MTIKNFISGFLKGQKLFGETISAIVNSFLLSIVYFLGVGSIFLVSKILRNKFLDLKPDKKINSYWNELNLGKKPLEEYYRQF